MRCTDENKSNSEIEYIIVTTYESKILKIDTTILYVNRCQHPLLLKYRHEL